MIYLDNAATTFPKPEMVLDVMDQVNRTCSVNAGRGAYALAKQATSIIDETKWNIAKLVGLQDGERVIFTPSVTIAINQVLNGISWTKGDIVYVSPYEHNAVARTLEVLHIKYELQIIEMPLDEKTLEIDLEALKYLFTEKQPKCVCLNCISNVTGYILPVEEIVQMAKSFDSLVLLDTAQALGLIDIKVQRIPADFIVFAGHKTLYGPFGIGGFIYNSSYELIDFIVGGTGSDSLNLQMPKDIPGKYESSSQNIVAIAGLNAALKWRSETSDIEGKERHLTNYAVEKLKTLSNIRLYLPENGYNHIGIISFNLLGYKADEIGMILDQDFNIAVRTGYHCAPFIHRWLKDKEYQGTVRIGIGYFNTENEIDKLIEALRELIDEM